MHRFSTVFLSVVCTGLIITSVPHMIYADDAAAGAVKTRIAKFKELGGHMKAMGSALEAGTTDAATLQPHAEEIAALAKDLPSWFPEGTGPESGADTKATADIWAKPDAFHQASVNFQDQAAKLVSISSSGDAAAIGAQLKAVGGTCGGCHKQFRKE